MPPPGGHYGRSKCRRLGLPLRAGLFFFIDLLLNFHVGYMASYNVHRKIIMDRRTIARLYVFHGTFWVDLISCGAWFTQARVAVGGSSGLAVQGFSRWALSIEGKKHDTNSPAGRKRSCTKLACHGREAARASYMCSQEKRQA